MNGHMSNEHPQPPGTEHFHDCGTQKTGVFRKLYWTFCQTCGYSTGSTRHKEVADALTKWHIEHPTQEPPVHLQ